jgi:hypothetical protein
VFKDVISVQIFDSDNGITDGCVNGQSSLGKARNVTIDLLVDTPFFTLVTEKN